MTRLGPGAKGPQVKQGVRDFDQTLEPCFEKVTNSAGAIQATSK